MKKSASSAKMAKKENQGEVVSAHDTGGSIPGYFTINQAAKRLKITPSLVTRYCREGRFDSGKKKGAIPLGKQWMVLISALEEFEKHPRERGNPNFGSL